MARKHNQHLQQHVSGKLGSKELCAEHPWFAYSPLIPLQQLHIAISRQAWTSGGTVHNSSFSPRSWSARRCPTDRVGEARSAMRGHRASASTHAVGRRAPPFGSRPSARPRRRGPQPYFPIRFSARSWRIERLGATQAVTLVRIAGQGSLPLRGSSPTVWMPAIPIDLVIRPPDFHRQPPIRDARHCCPGSALYFMELSVSI